MQVEHKTEKGTILFIKVPEDASDLTHPKIGMVDLYFQTKIKSKHEEDNHISVALPNVGFEFIALTTDITEEQAGMMVDYGMDYTEFGFANYMWEEGKVYKYPFDAALESFKSLMQHLQLSEGKWVVLFKPN